MESKKSRYSVPNLERALDILQLLAENPIGYTSTELSEKLNIPRNSVFRITSTLLERNFLFRDEETKAFRLSPKLLTLGYSSVNEESLIEKSIDVMRKLRDKFGETVPLGVLHRGKGIIVEEMPGNYSFRFVLEPGRNFSLHTAAPAKAIIAFLPEDERDELINKIQYKKYNDRTITSSKKYQEYLKIVHKKGYATDYAEEIEGMHCIAAPIFNRRGYPVAAIWISGPSFRVKESQFDEIGEQVKEFAFKISSRLGFNGFADSNLKIVDVA